MPDRPIFFKGRRAAESLDVVVVGGGMAGLTAAFALQLAGHKTVVLDEHEEHVLQQGAGVQITPNAMKILDHWGVGGTLRELSFQPIGLHIRSHSDSSIIASNNWCEEVASYAGAPYICIEYSKLYRIIFDLAHSAGVKVLYNKRAQSVDLPTNTISCEDNTSYKAHLIVGADGACSLVRRTIFPLADANLSVPSCMSSLTVSNVEMHKDSELKELFNDQHGNLWMGPSRWVWAYPLNNGEYYGFDLHYPSPNSKRNSSVTKDDTLWQHRDLEGIREDWSDWCPSIRKLLSTATSAPTCADYDIPPLKYFHYPSPSNEDEEEEEEEEDIDHSSHRTVQSEGNHSSGHVVLVGQAAHPARPATSGGFGMIIEDAKVLGSLFSRHNPRNAITTVGSLLNAYSEVRHERATASILFDRETSDTFSLPSDSEEACARNIAYVSSGEALLEKTVELWSSHAGDDAEEWWIDWRLPMERSAAALKTGSEDEVRKGSDKGNLSTVTVAGTI